MREGQKKDAIAGEAKQARTRKVLKFIIASVVVIAVVVIAYFALSVRQGQLELKANQVDLEDSQLDLAAKTSNFLGIEAEQGVSGSTLRQCDAYRFGGF